ncbi:hypothetical protein [Achromobacter denitrificans]|uniref:hypothetical protein n=1 Tax=Achromobacter denitrificans TaxID=32002 RepID=UPI000F663445|nr:hypothetical protein [Achromobacter denitrificans]RSE78526.1 hypothetical protein EGU64_25770 [Achromobacter denitrificans]
MIPISLPSTEFFVFLFVSQLAGLALLGWLAVLAASRRARQRFGRRPWLHGGALLALAALSAFYVFIRYVFWTVDREYDRLEAARRVTLEQPQTLGGVAMPAGARLVLAREGQPERYTEATFEAPVPAFGMQATRIVRYLRTEYDRETYEELGAHPHTLYLWGAGVQDVAGWRCDTMEKVEFRVEKKDARPEFESCTLGAGNRAGEIALPAGAEVRARKGETYTNGHVEPLNWYVSVDSPEPLAVSGMLLGRPGLRLDDAHRLLGVASAALACPLRLGPYRYPAGTRVQSTAYPLNRRLPDAWVLTPDHGMTVLRDDGEALSEGMSVVQRGDGEVLATLPNAEAGVMLFATIEVEGAPPQASVRCPS